MPLDVTNIAKTGTHLHFLTNHYMPLSGDQTNYSSLKFERFRQNWRIWRGNQQDLTELPADLAERVVSTSHGLFVDTLFSYFNVSHDDEQGQEKSVSLNI